MGGTLQADDRVAVTVGSDEWERRGGGDVAERGRRRPRGQVRGGGHRGPVGGEEEEPITVQFPTSSWMNDGVRLMCNAHAEFSGFAGGSSTALTLRDASRMHVTGGAFQSADDEGIWAQETSEVVIEAVYCTGFGDRDGIRVWDSSRLEINSLTGTVYSRDDDAIDVDQQGTAWLRNVRLFGGNDGVKAKQQSHG